MLNSRWEVDTNKARCGGGQSFHHSGSDLLKPWTIAGLHWSTRRKCPLQNSKDAISEMFRFSHQYALKSIFRAREINGLKTFWHIFSRVLYHGGQSLFNWLETLQWKEVFAVGGARRGWSGSLENEGNSLTLKAYLRCLIWQFISSSGRYEKLNEQSRKKKKGWEQNIKRGYKVRDDVYKSLMNGTFLIDHLNTLFKKKSSKIQNKIFWFWFT